MIVCGIDPGLRGGIAIVDVEDQVLLAAQEMPLVKETKNSKNKILDVCKFQKFLTDMQPESIVIERVASRPAQSSQSTFTFGRMYGAIESIVYLQKCVVEQGMFERVEPRVWKKAFGLSSDKGKSKESASKLLLIDDINLLNKISKSDGIAEAALIALYPFQREGKIHLSAIERS